MVIKEGGPFFMGTAVLAFGVGLGYLMFAFPEGLDPQWPLGMALLVPAVMAMSGLYMIGDGLGFPRFSVAMIRIVPLLLLGVVNWGVFLTSGALCTATLSFFGVELNRWQPSESECRNIAGMVVLSFDALFVVALLVPAWGKLRKAWAATPERPRIRATPASCGGTGRRGRTCA